jgi:hypothetical protein
MSANTDTNIEGDHYCGECAAERRLHARTTRVMLDYERRLEQAHAKLDDAEKALCSLTAVMHRQCLDTGLITVSQWNTEIAPKLMALRIAIRPNLDACECHRAAGTGTTPWCPIHGGYRV